jgi:transcriptional regulator with XRE-family HTH domain
MSIGGLRLSARNRWQVACVTLGEYVQKVKDDTHLSLSVIVKNSRGALSQTYVSKILHDQIKNPSQQKLQALALAMKRPANEFVNFRRGDPPREPWTAFEAVRAMESIIVSPALTDVVKVLLDLLEPEIEKCARYVGRYKKK